MFVCHNNITISQNTNFYFCRQVLAVFRLVNEAKAEATQSEAEVKATESEAESSRGRGQGRGHKLMETQKQQ